MSQGQARAWWADVEHLREAAERRIADRQVDDVPERRAAPVEALERDWASEAAAEFDELAARRGRRADSPPPAAESPSAAVLRDLTRSTRSWAGDDADAYPGADAHQPAGRFARAADAPPGEPPAIGRFARDAGDAPPAGRFARADRDDSPAQRTAERAERRAEPVELERSRRTRDEHGVRRRATADAPASARRTIEIRGQVVPPRHSPQAALRAQAAQEAGALPVRSTRRRPSRTPAERFAARPDRIALWAFLFGVFLIIVALTSAH